ncbi:MAG: hypothetical protein KGJ74_04865 [Betaproteobacteria bacterium]|nr:hypothetical protein [Betaproteobacteria bacterium]
MEAKDCFEEAPFDTSKVARDVHSALALLGVAMPGVDAMVRGAARLAFAFCSHGWNDWEAVDFIQQFATDAIGEGLGWRDWISKTFHLLRVWKDGDGKARIRGAKDIDEPAHGEDGQALHEVIAVPSQDRRGSLDAELPEQIEPVADFLRDAPSKTISKTRGVSARMGRYDTAKLIRATALAVRDPGLLGSLEFDPVAWASRPKAGRGGRPSKAALAQRAARAQQQQSLF